MIMAIVNGKRLPKGQLKIALNDVLDEITANMKKCRNALNIPYEDDYHSYLNGVDKCLEIVNEYRKEQE